MRDWPKFKITDRAPGSDDKTIFECYRKDYAEVWFREVGGEGKMHIRGTQSVWIVGRKYKRLSILLDDGREYVEGGMPKG